MPPFNDPSLNLDRLQADAISSSSFTRDSANRRALERLRLLLGRKADRSEAEGRQNLFGTGGILDNPRGDKFFAGQREGVESLGLQQFLKGETPSTTPTVSTPFATSSAMQALRKVGSQLSSQEFEDRFRNDPNFDPFNPTRRTR